VYTYGQGQTNYYNKIHCFKPNGSMPTGLESLQQKRVDAQFAQIWDAIDLAQDGDSCYKSDNSIDFVTQ
jgi:hypothetical protein